VSEYVLYYFGCRRFLVFTGFKGNIISIMRPNAIYLQCLIYKSVNYIKVQNAVSDILKIVAYINCFLVVLIFIRNYKSCCYNENYDSPCLEFTNKLFIETWIFYPCIITMYCYRTTTNRDSVLPMFCYLILN